MLTLPLFRELGRAKTVLLAGAGGGFDLFSGLPLYFALRNAGKTVHLANLSFSNLRPDCGRHLTPECVEVTPDSPGNDHFFPEKHLSAWFKSHGKDVPVYCIHRAGARPAIDAYRALHAELKFDTALLVDGGTDSLMRGDEDGLGTPHEDMASIAAAHALGDAVPNKILACLGFGIDAFHGVCHAHVLEAVAELTASGGYLGACSLTLEMPEVQRYAEVMKYVLDRTPDRPSIVSTSILSALEGRYGNYHATSRTMDSDLYINPLMSIYFAFRLDHVARRVRYLEYLSHTETYSDIDRAIHNFRSTLPELRRRRTLPM